MLWDGDVPHGQSPGVPTPGCGGRGLRRVAASRHRPSLSLCAEPLISTSDILSRIKQEVAFVGEQQFAEERGMPADPCAGELCLAPAAPDAFRGADGGSAWLSPRARPSPQARMP